MTPEERALLADLKMYDQADERSRDEEIMDEEIARRAPDIKDKKALREAQVRYDAREFDKKHKPEIGPVDENLKLEEPDYEIPWSGKIDENKKVLGNAIELGKMAMGDFSDSYLPEEAQKALELAMMVDPETYAAMGAAALAPKVLKGTSKAGKIFVSPVAEHNFWTKTVGDEAAQGFERLSDRARDVLSDAYINSNKRGLKIKNNKSEDIAVTGARGRGSNKVNLGSKDDRDRMNNTLHESTHHADNEFGTTTPLGDTEKFMEQMDNNPLIQELTKKYIAEVDAGHFTNEWPKSAMELYHWVDEQLKKTPHYAVMSQRDRFPIYGAISDYINLRTTKDGRRLNDVIGGAHEPNYGSPLEKLGWEPAGGEGVANTTALMGSPMTGRWWMSQGLPNENAYFSQFKYNAPDFDDSKLAKGTETGLLGRDYKPKMKLNGSKYKDWLEEEAERFDPSLMTPFAKNGRDEKLAEFRLGVENAGIGDRYGRVFKNGDPAQGFDDGGYHLSNWVLGDVKNTKIPTYRTEVRPKLKEWEAEQKHYNDLADLEEQILGGPTEKSKGYRASADSLGKVAGHYLGKHLHDKK